MEMETLQLHFVRQLLVSSRGGEEGREPAPLRGLWVCSTGGLWGQCRHKHLHKASLIQRQWEFLAGLFLMPQKVFIPFSSVLPSAFKMFLPVPGVQDLKGNTELG